MKEVENNRPQEILTFTGRLSHSNKRFEGGWVATVFMGSKSCEKH